MDECIWQQHGNIVRCEECGTERPEPRRRACGVKHGRGSPQADAAEAIRVQRLGDRLQVALEEIGVTPKSWQDFKGVFGLPQTCNCDSRKEWLNQLDQRFGLGEKLTVFTKALGWSK